MFPKKVIDAARHINDMDSEELNLTNQYLHARMAEINGREAVKSFWDRVENPTVEAPPLKLTAPEPLDEHN